MKKIKKSTWLPCLLLIYLSVMSAIGWQGYVAGKSTALYFFGSIAFTLLVIIALHFFLKKKESLQKNQEKLSDM